MDAGNLIASLSPRERECLLWCALGLRTKQIANVLNIAEPTVNEYIASAIKKLGAASRPQAAALLVQAGMDLGDESK